MGLYFSENVSDANEITHDVVIEVACTITLGWDVEQWKPVSFRRNIGSFLRKKLFLFAPLSDIDWEIREVGKINQDNLSLNNLLEIGNCLKDFDGRILATISDKCELEYRE